MLSLAGSTAVHTYGFDTDTAICDPCALELRLQRGLVPRLFVRLSGENRIVEVGSILNV
jgi:hypothetical protein